MTEGFVGVHIGAGQHSEARTSLYLSICAKACQVAIDILKEGGSAIEAATEATMVLEDAGETNAGYGSNLTELGTVEMDAGLMDGDSLLFGAVGAVPGIKNPIQVAKLLVLEQGKERDIFLDNLTREIDSINSGLLVTLINSVFFFHKDDITFTSKKSSKYCDMLIFILFIYIYVFENR